MLLLSVERFINWLTFGVLLALLPFAIRTIVNLLLTGNLVLATYNHAHELLFFSIMTSAFAHHESNRIERPHQWDIFLLALRSMTILALVLAAILYGSILSFSFLDQDNIGDSSGRFFMAAIILAGFSLVAGFLVQAVVSAAESQR